MLGVIRVLTTDDEGVLNEHGRLMADFVQDPIISKCISDHPNGIYDEVTMQSSIPKIIELAKQMVDDYPLRAITISCAADPALAELRQAVAIPVLSAGLCGVFAAKIAGQKIGVMGITDEAPEQMVAELGDYFHSYAYADSFRKTTSLFSPDAKQELTELAYRLYEDGADTILFACTGFSTIQLKKHIQDRLDIPIIDLVEAQAISYSFI